LRVSGCFPGRWPGYVEGVPHHCMICRGDVVFPAVGRATLKAAVLEPDVVSRRLFSRPLAGLR